MEMLDQLALVELLMNTEHRSLSDHLVMSLASKIFLGTSLVAAGSVVYGVHYLQKREQAVSV